MWCSVCFKVITCQSLGDAVAATICNCLHTASKESWKAV